MISETPTNAASADAQRPASSTKSPERIAAAEAIKEGIRRWSGGLYTDGPQLPVVRAGDIIEHFGSEANDPVEQVLRGSVLPSEKRTAEDRERLAKLASSLRQCASACSAFEDAELRKLAKGTRRGRTTEERVSFALDVEKALLASMTLLLEAAEERIALLDKKAEEQPRKRGRKKDTAVYTVAAALAQLYAKITGKRPTYSEGADGLSGEYTPVLRNVFDALGWKKTTLRGPEKAAVSAVTAADLHLKELPPPLGLSPSSSGCVPEHMRSAFQRILKEAQEEPDDPPHPP
ncbi:hypothetical protein [Paracoccus marcusii]|uniref:hypothetical protein n=1 Tax=Paracoccus marcusii TaxID=59779 RepID=UPI0032643788